MGGASHLAWHRGPLRPSGERLGTRRKMQGSSLDLAGHLWFVGVCSPGNGLGVGTGGGGNSHAVCHSQCLANAGNGRPPPGRAQTHALLLLAISSLMYLHLYLQ